jgi:hypothetical protein
VTGARTAPGVQDVARLGCFRRAGLEWLELAGLAFNLAIAALARFVALPTRGGWDSDQGTEMLALRHALQTGRLPTFGPEAISVATPFHHGALYYDLLLPAAWLGNGDPTWVVAEIALLSLLVIPACWWMARTIGGPAAGFAAAFLAATSASLIGYATFIWNPTLVDPAAAVAFLGAWQALRTGSGRWWLLAAAGAAVAMQAHVAAGVIVAPLGAVFLVQLRRSPGRRGPLVRWGAAGVALVVLAYVPMIAFELTHDFADTRAMVAYFTDPSAAPAQGPLLRLLFALIRVLAWPLTRWPIADREGAVGIAFLVASGALIGLVWRMGSVLGLAPRAGSAGGGGQPDPDARGHLAGQGHVAAQPNPAGCPDLERLGTWFVGGSLLLIVTVLGLGLAAVSQIQELPTEQYHVVADPLVLVAAGLIVGGLWRALPRRGLTLARRGAGLAAVVALVAWNVVHWPAASWYDGGWPAAQAAAQRVERDVAGSELALVPLYVPKGTDAYGYPLVRDGFSLVPASDARTVVVLCDAFWTAGCGGAAEDAWLASSAEATGLTLVDRFAAAPDRTLSVYVRR